MSRMKLLSRMYVLWPGLESHRVLCEFLPPVPAVTVCPPNGDSTAMDVACQVMIQIASGFCWTTVRKDVFSAN